ncbi:MAG: type II secretion system F family protein [Candidatus Aenigmarchaeota archaeon]|nr:type II secretion system F family protein [Candidatus Aenigmarchaeota archaeon]
MMKVKEEKKIKQKEKKSKPYTKRFEITPNIKILLASLVVSAFFLAVGIISNDRAVLGNSIILSAFAIAGPLFFFRYMRVREIKEMEEKFPFFLRDVIEALRSGSPLHTSVLIASKYEYGKLTPEIKKMASQISWGMSFDKVLDQFAERVKASKRLTVVSKIIKEAYLSGGDIISILETVAENMTILDEYEKERKSLLSQYVVLMYIINFLFIGIVVGINRLMVPIFKVEAVGQLEMIGLQNPCGFCSQLSCVFCDILGGISSIFNLGNIRSLENMGSYYTSLFFLMAIVESIFCGLVAGEISEGSAIAGFKHSIIMVIITFGSFFILVNFGIMGV